MVSIPYDVRKQIEEIIGNPQISDIERKVSVPIHGFGDDDWYLTEEEYRVFLLVYSGTNPNIIDEDY
ncbi:hypothetical protein HYT56_05040 [Candidatus Woesearchaeota archaeon]|nr:hypothetical protein [Candidatus Woesearchaeota archaeon]